MYNQRWLLRFTGPSLRFDCSPVTFLGMNRRAILAASSLATMGLFGCSTSSSPTSEPDASTETMTTDSGGGVTDGSTALSGSSDTSVHSETNSESEVDTSQSTDSSADASPNSSGDTSMSVSMNTSTDATDSSTGEPAIPLPPQLAWTREQTSEIIEEMWGSGPEDIYAVGRGGIILHSSGNGEWDYQDSGTSANLTGIWGSGPNDIYVSVDANVILHSIGDGVWEHQDYDPGTTFRGIWGLDADHVYAIGPGVIRRSSTQTWGPPEEVTNGTPLTAMWGSSAEDLYITTGSAAGSIIFHSTGDGVWRAQAAPDAQSADDIWGSDAQHMYAAADSDVLASNGDGNWRVELSTDSAVDAIWTHGTDAAYACTANGMVYRSNGNGDWSEEQRIADAALTVRCLAIWGTGMDNIYLGTSAGIFHGTPQ